MARQSPPTGVSSQRLEGLLVVLCLLLLGLRLWRLADRYAVNILYWDQWDFYTPLFQDRSLWEVFNWQHGPPRLGVGLLLTKFLAAVSGWDCRVEVFASVITLCLASVAAVVLRYRLLGPLKWYDAAIPLAFLTPLQWELFVAAPNPAHGPVPLLLGVLYCLGWTISRQTVRYGIVLSLNFLLIFTGFGLFVGVLTPLLLTVDLVVLIRDRNRDATVLCVAGLCLCMLSWAVFSVGYVFWPAVDCFRFPEPNGSYAKYVALAYSGLFGLRESVDWPYAVPGGIFVVSAMAILACRFGRLIHRGHPMQPLDVIIVVLVGFSLLFSVGSAIGRVCLGYENARASRYIPYLVPGVFGAYLHVIAMPARLVRTAAVTLLMAGLVWGALPLGPADMKLVAWYAIGKGEWKETFLSTEDIEAANRLSRFPVHPDPVGTRMADKMKFFKTHRFNLYLDQTGR
ncbi:MAG: hypothetical protein AB1646_07490 [Thermodesulfobacteriota bacterium]